MKTTLILFLLSISLLASQTQTDENSNTTEIPQYMVDAKTFSMINSTEAFYIIGGSKYGIMTKRVAFAKKEDAEEYAKTHGGEVVDYTTYIESLKKSE